VVEAAELNPACEDQGQVEEGQEDGYDWEMHFGGSCKLKLEVKKL
jgi:hypothetical protein